MKKKKSPTNYLFNLLILALLVSCFTSTVHSRTLIFQADAEKNTTQQSTTSVQSLKDKNAYKSDSSIISNSQPVAQNSANSELFFMIEQLKQEVNSLRGMLEEQSYELRMLKQSGKDRYQDLDTRILDITKRLSAGSMASNSVTQSFENAPSVKPAKAVEQKTRKLNSAEPVKQREPTVAENNDYQKAYSLIKEKKFDDAIISLFSYTENYPDSPLLPNVYYWLGEVYLATSKLEQAKTSFSLVVSAYPNSQKSPDSLYKLAVTLDRLGDTDLAKQYINDVKSKYPDSTAAKLAANYKVIE